MSLSQWMYVCLAALVLVAPVGSAVGPSPGEEPASTAAEAKQPTGGKEEPVNVDPALLVIRVQTINAAGQKTPVADATVTVYVKDQPQQHTTVDATEVTFNVNGVESVLVRVAHGKLQTWQQRVQLKSLPDRQLTVLLEH